MKTYQRVEIQLHVLTSAQARGEWLTSRSGHFTPGKTVAGTQCIGGWVKPRAGLDAVAKVKIPIVAGYRNPVLHPTGNLIY